MPAPSMYVTEGKGNGSPHTLPTMPLLEAPCSCRKVARIRASARAHPCAVPAPCLCRCAPCLREKSRQVSVSRISERVTKHTTKVVLVTTGQAELTEHPPSTQVQEWESEKKKELVSWAPFCCFLMAVAIDWLAAEMRCTVESGNRHTHPQPYAGVWRYGGAKCDLLARGMPTVIEQAELRSSHLYASAGEFDELEWRAEAAGGNSNNKIYV